MSRNKNEVKDIDNETKQRNMLLKFFLTCNKIGAFTLGGGYAMIPIMEQEFVDKNHWMERQEFMDIMDTDGIIRVRVIK